MKPTPADYDRAVMQPQYEEARKKLLGLRVCLREHVPARVFVVSSVCLRPKGGAHELGVILTGANAIGAAYELYFPVDKLHEEYDFLEVL